MKAMVIVKTEGGGTLEWRDVPDPNPGPGEILLHVRATGLNRADLGQRQGTYPAQGAGGVVIAGLEAAGEVAALGPGVSGLAIGDRVMATCAGGYAQLTTVHHRLCVPIPPTLSFEQAASLPVAIMTEHDALVTNGRLQKGEIVLINAASSCVGVIGIQIARIMGAGRIIATSTSDAKLAVLASSLGVDAGINTKRESLAEAALAATGGAGVDVLIDHVGASQFADNLKSLALRGRLVSVGRLGGRTSELDLDYLALRRLSLIGVTFRTRTMDERIAIADRVKADLTPALADGRLVPIIDRVFPLTEALEAQRYMTTNAQVGKIVLRA